MGWLANIVGVMVVFYAISMRQSRTDDREAELDKLRNDQKVAEFWGLDSAEEKRQLNEKIAQQHSAKNNWKFAIRNWGAISLGILLVLGSRMLNEKALFGQDDGIVIAIGFALFWFYKHGKVLSKLERALSWQEQMLRSVKDHAEDMRKGSIEEYLELKEKIAKL